MKTSPGFEDGMASNDSMDEILPFFSAFNMNILNLIILVPLSFCTLKSIFSLANNVPDSGLKTPAILILMGPLVVQIYNFVCV